MTLRIPFYCALGRCVDSVPPGIPALRDFFHNIPHSRPAAAVCPVPVQKMYLYDLSCPTNTRNWNRVPAWHQKTAAWMLILPDYSHPVQNTSPAVHTQKNIP